MEDRKLSKILGSVLNMNEILSLVALALLIVIPFYFYAQLPEEIPVHFDGKGNANRMGDKKEIWVIPAIGLFVYILLTALRKLPFHAKPMDQKPLEVQKENHVKSLELLQILKAVILWLFVAVIWFSSKSAIDGDGSLPVWLLPIFMISIFGVIIWSMSKMK